MGTPSETQIEALRRLQPSGEPTREQLVEWAHGQAAIENPAVTRETAERAVDRALRDRAATKK
jgi:hypothetical protein